MKRYLILCAAALATLVAFSRPDERPTNHPRNLTFRVPGAGDRNSRAIAAKAGAAPAAGVPSIRPADLVSRATAGEPRAQYLLGEQLRGCSGVVAVYHATGESDDTLEGCERLMQQTDRPWQQWHQAALEAGDPLAVLQDAYEQFMTKAAPRDELERALRQAEASGDADARRLARQIDAP